MHRLLLQFYSDRWRQAIQWVGPSVGNSVLLHLSSGSSYIYIIYMYIYMKIHSSYICIYIYIYIHIYEEPLGRLKSGQLYVVILT